MPAHVFISYAHQDQAYVDRLAAFVEGRGLRVWHDRQIQLGENFAQVVMRAIEEAAAVVAVISVASNDSNWVQEELRYTERLGRPILPLWLSGEVPPNLRTLGAEDVRRGNLPSEAFVEALGRILSGPTPPLRAADVEPLVSLDATKVFISYRQADSAFAAHWLHRELAACFREDGNLPENSFFIDVDSVHFGTRIRSQVEQAIKQCQVMLVVIGDRWLTAELNGRRRLDLTNDMVRQEIELALDNGVTIIPILVYPAEMPDVEFLPESIRELAEFRGMTVYAHRFQDNARFLAEKLKQIIRI